MRVAKTTGPSTTSYVQDLAAPLPLVLVETTGTQNTLYIYGFGLIAQVQPNGARSYYHADALGSTRVLTNAAGQVTGSYAYDAFGSVRSQTGGSGNPFTFTGEQTDPETGFVLLRARYYDSSIGRFASRDPFPFIPVITASINPYVYVINNPVLLTDHTGLSALFQLLGPIGLLGDVNNSDRSVMRTDETNQRLGAVTASGRLGQSSDWEALEQYNYLSAQRNAQLGGTAQSLGYTGTKIILQTQLIGASGSSGPGTAESDAARQQIRDLIEIPGRMYSAFRFGNQIGGWLTAPSDWLVDRAIHWLDPTYQRPTDHIDSRRVFTWSDYYGNWADVGAPPGGTK